MVVSGVCAEKAPCICAQVLRTYSQFTELRDVLYKIDKALPKLPGKSLLGGEKVEATRRVFQTLCAWVEWLERLCALCGSVIESARRLFRRSSSMSRSLIACDLRNLCSISWRSSHRPPRHNSQLLPRSASSPPTVAKAKCLQVHSNS